MAEAYLKQREEMGFPGRKHTNMRLALKTLLPEVNEPCADLLLEIGTEELPTEDLETALEQFGRCCANCLRICVYIIKPFQFGARLGV